MHTLGWELFDTHSWPSVIWYSHLDTCGVSPGYVNDIWVNFRWMPGYGTHEILARMLDHLGIVDTLSFIRCGHFYEWDWMTKWNARGSWDAIDYTRENCDPLPVWEGPLVFVMLGKAIRPFMYWKHVSFYVLLYVGQAMSFEILKPSDHVLCVV